MKVIRPALISDGSLVSSTVAEPYTAAGEVAWNASTAYTAGQRVVRSTTHRVYERVVNGTTPGLPELDSTNWFDVGPTARWAMFDNQVSTATYSASPLTVVLAPGNVNGLALLDVGGTSVHVTITDGVSGPTVYDRTVSLDGTVITDWYQYLWEPPAPLTDVVLTDLPPYAAARITVAITGSSPSCGVAVVGTVYDLGDTKLGAKVGIIDYSRKTTDDFGTVTFVRRGFAKRAQMDMLLPMAQINKVQRLMAELRATPCVWIGSELAEHSPLTVFGFFKDFSITLSYPKLTLCSLDIEGLI